MAPKRELSLAAAFFAALAVLIVGFMRPLDWVGGACLVTSVNLRRAWVLRVVEGARLASATTGWAISRPGAPRSGGCARTARLGCAGGEPSNEERAVLETTFSALAEAEALAPGEVDAPLSWRAAQHIDPGQPAGAVEALYALAILQDFGLFAPRRLVFVQSHTEYDAALLAAITASVLTSLGHGIGPDDVTVVLPGKGAEERASMAFPLEGRRETLGCDFL